MMDDKDTTYGIVCKMERPLGIIRRLGDGLALITETIEEPGASAMNEIVNTMLDKVTEIDKIYSVLFRLHHPGREQFERDGWPEDKADDDKTDD